MKHFIGIEDYPRQQLLRLIALGRDIKKNPVKYSKKLAGKTVALIFEKPSLRTKTSFYIGAFQLGGQPIYFTPQETELGKREKINDVSRTMSQFVDVVVLRTFAHKNLKEFVKYATIPVINALSDFSHPSQVLGDLITILEEKKQIKGIKIAYIGDGNNVCNSLIHAISIIGGNLYIATPKKYKPSSRVLSQAAVFAKKSKAKIKLVSVKEAAANADVLYTDVWASMGQEKEVSLRRLAFEGYQINDRVVAMAKKNAIVLHCLPAHRGQEITDSVIESKHSRIFEQAGNRLHAAKAILLHVFS